MEVLVPLKEEGRFWDWLQKFGEGTSIIVFGVQDMDAAKQRALEAEDKSGPEVQLGGTEPCYDRFETFREVGLGIFDQDLPVSIALSQIEPRW